MAPTDLANFLAGNGAGLDDTSPTAPAGGPVAPPTAPAAEPIQPMMRGAPARLSGRYEIFPDDPLADLDTDRAAAFAARRTDSSARELVAWVLHGSLPARLEVIGSLQGVVVPSMLHLVESGVVHWPPSDAERFVVLLEKPAGVRLIKSLQQQRPPMSEDQVTRQVILPMVGMLRELKLRRIFHGAINPLNLFFREGRAGVELGECVTGPAGYNQPVLFETIERGLAEPSGKGLGTMADDLYAFGVTILFLLAGYNPIHGADPQTILDLKIEKGSFGALIGNARLPLGILEPLRGLLLDDARERWTFEDLEQWASGRRLSPKQVHSAKRSPRSISFEGAEYWTARGLSAALCRSPLAASALIEGGELDTWLRRSLDDEAMAQRVVEAVRSAASSRGGSPEERRAARVAMALDPQAPIRYRGRAVLPDGVGSALGDAMVRGAGVQEIADIIASQLPAFWVNVQEVFRPEFVPMAKTFDAQRAHLERSIPGYGIERCLYELNPSVSCLSSILKGRHVIDLKQLLRAIEELGGRPDRPTEPMDRHIAAFIMSRSSAINDRHLQALRNEVEPHLRAVAILDIFHEVQQRTKLGPLPNLCAWVGTLLQGATKRFHSRTLRERMTTEIAKQVSTGLLKNLAVLAHNESLVARDAAGFLKARREYVVAALNIARRERELADAASIKHRLGDQITAAAASFAAMVLLVGIVVFQAG